MWSAAFIKSKRRKIIGILGTRMEENLFEGVQWELIHIKDSTPMFEYGYMLKCFCFYQVECNHIPYVQNSP